MAWKWLGTMKTLVDVPRFDCSEELLGIEAGQDLAGASEEHGG